MIKHLLIDIIFFVLIIILPYWLTVLLAIFLLFYFKNFNEIIIFGFIMDLYYSDFGIPFNIFDYKFTLLFFFLLILSFYFKKRLKFNYK